MSSAAASLFVVATPLGNLEDITPRAARVLGEVDVLFAEDTRRTRVLLEHLGLHRHLDSLHQHNERSRIESVLGHLGAGRSVALVSDAGTPAVSDPGAQLVRAVADAGFRVVPIPGPSALAAALSAAGFTTPGTAVLFVGFLPVKGKARRTSLQQVGTHTGVVVLYEAPHRAHATLADLAALDPQRPICVCRELTKVHEEIRRGSAADIAAWAEQTPRGELTVVVGPKPAGQPTDDEAHDDAAVDAALQRCLDAGLSARDAAAAVAAVLERPKRAVYNRCQALLTAE